MQERKVVVTIKTIDDEHCHDDCILRGLSYQQESLCFGKEFEEDSVGYLRTEACKKGEVT